MELNDFQSIIRLKLTTYWRLLFCMFYLLTLSTIHISNAQDTTRTLPIRELHEGYLLVRFPRYEAKIDTLKAMMERSGDGQSRARLEKLMRETEVKRDSLFAQYIRAFRNQNKFSKTAYFFDTDARNLNSDIYYSLDGERLDADELMKHPVFYLFFERTEESKIDAMVIYDRKLKKVPPPFPNNFAQGGLNLLIVKIAEKKFPEWRVSKMNKRFWKYYDEVRFGF